jgi:sugar phosphate isomerase/epimerase
MKIGLLTDGLGVEGLDAMLALAADLGVEAVEFGCGGWSDVPHLDLDRLVRTETARVELLAKVAEHGLEISALNVSGNPLKPGADGALHDRQTRQAIRLAGLLGIDRVVLMSGLPAAPGDRHPNWINVAWPPELAEVLEYQWAELVRYWEPLVATARMEGVERLCVEMHAHQLVYNVPTLLRLRQIVGTVVGATYDPSHLVWMGADPIAGIAALGDAIYHVHAKDTKIEAAAALTSRFETLPNDDADSRSWNYVTLGHGHDAEFWRTFCLALADHGYDGALSIEHEDARQDPIDGVRESVALLRSVLHDDA